MNLLLEILIPDYKAIGNVGGTAIVIILSIYMKILKVVYPLSIIVGMTPLVPTTATTNSSIIYFKESSKKLNLLLDLQRIYLAIYPLTVKKPV